VKAGIARVRASLARDGKFERAGVVRLRLGPPSADGKKLKLARAAVS
jgi:hypothetical protein